MALLTWNGSQYEADYDETRKLYVDGDVFSESVMDSSIERIQLQHQHHIYLTVNEARDLIANTEEGEYIYELQRENLLHSDMWEACAIEVDSLGQALIPHLRGQEHLYSAWIQ